MTQLNTKSSKAKSTVFILLIIMIGSGFVTTHAQNTLEVWQMNALTQPSEALILAEAKGRITIYDGLNNLDVEQALNSQFNRIENMMFVRTKHQKDDANIEEEDDDC